ncbi:MAG: FtsX-like permease family protein [Tepidisphaeraceae bacterium]
MLFKLALANLRAHRIRLALAVTATALAVSLVVSITSGFASLDRMIRSFTMAYLGSVDFEIDRPIQGLKPGLSQAIVDELKKDPRVRDAYGRIQRDTHPIREDGGILFNIPSVTLFGINPAVDSYVKVMRPIGGRWFGPGERDSIVVDSNLAGKLDLKVGDTLRFPGQSGVLEVKVSGVVKVPTIIGGLFMSAFVPLDRLQSFIDPQDPAGFDRIRGEFKPDAFDKMFIMDWQSRLKQYGRDIEIESKRESRDKLDANLRGMRIVSVWASSISILAAGFIIFSTLSMGVAERRRQLAMLRAVGATRLQVALLVVIEALTLAVLGVVIGLPLGIGMIHALAVIAPGMFTEGVALDGLGMLWAAFSCTGAALLASLIPAIIASRASPLEAMTHQANTPKARFPIRSLVAGAILTSLDTIVVFCPLDDLGRRIGSAYLAEHGHEVMVYVRFALTVPCLMIGLFLIAPTVVLIVEKLLGRVLAMVTKTRVELLRQQLSGSSWRAAGTAAALMVGLTVLVVMNAQGRSTLQAWRIPTRFPDVFLFVNAGMGTLENKQLDIVRNTPGVKPQRVLPIRVTIPGLGDNFFELASWVRTPQRTMFVATDPALLLEMMDLDFRAGNVDDARRMLVSGRRVTLADGSVLHGTIDVQSIESFDASAGKLPAPIEFTTLKGDHRTLMPDAVQRIERGRYLLVTNEVMRLKGLTVGDIMPLQSMGVGHDHFEYTIVGVVWSPGVDVIINAFDLPNRVEAQTAFAVFGTTYDIERDFNQYNARLIAADLDKGINSKVIQKQLQERVNVLGLTVIDVREFRDNLVDTFGRILGFMSLIAWSAMLVASLGVGNAVIAGVRSRQWQFGVLRSIGLTSSQLLRLVLIEGLLLGACGVALGLLGGVILSVNARAFYAEIVGFEPPMVIPWDVMILGSVAVLLLALAMSAWPAITTSRREPLGLLQAGRAAS